MEVILTRWQHKSFPTLLPVTRTTKIIHGQDTTEKIPEHGSEAEVATGTRDQDRSHKKIMESSTWMHYPSPTLVQHNTERSSQAMVPQVGKEYRVDICDPPVLWVTSGSPTLVLPHEDHKGWVGFDHCKSDHDREGEVEVRVATINA